MKFNIIYTLAAIAILATSCQDVIELDIPEDEKRVIINGRVTDSLPVYVEVFATVNYLSSNPNPGMSDCAVILYEDDVAVATLDENDTIAGRYESPFTGTEGKKYHVEVSFPEGHPYFSNSIWRTSQELLSRVPKVDSTYSKFEPDQPFIEEGYYAYVMFTEPAGLGDCYRVRVWKNDSLFNTQFDLTFFDDEFIDGRAFNDDLASGNLPAALVGDVSDTGDVIVAELSSISRQGYEFLEILQQQTVQVGSTFDPPPAPVYGNVFNKSNPNQLGLGYFFASKLSYATIEIKE